MNTRKTVFYHATCIYHDNTQGYSYGIFTNDSFMYNCDSHHDAWCEFLQLLKTHICKIAREKELLIIDMQITNIQVLGAFDPDIDAWEDIRRTGGKDEKN